MSDIGLDFETGTQLVPGLRPVICVGSPQGEWCQDQHHCENL